MLLSHSGLGMHLVQGEFVRGLGMSDLGWDVEGWQVPERPPHVEIEGSYARLEPLTLSRHASSLWDAFALDAEGHVWDYLPSGPFQSLNQFYKMAKDLEPSTDPLFFAVRDLETDQLGGFLSYLRIAPEAGSIEVGYITFAPQLQNTKAGTEAIILMARRAFALGYRRFEWKCNALNLASRRAAERYGFSYEGIFRQAAVVKGRNRDTAWFAMIDKEWDQIDAAYSRWLEPRNFVSTGRQIHSLRDMTAPLLVARDPMVLSDQAEP